MLKEVPRTGAHSEDFVLSSESPRRWPERLRIGYFAACAAWAVAWALGVAESMELLGALLIAAFVFHLGAHLVSMVWLGPVTSWSVDTGAQRVTGILRPRTHEWRRVFHTYSTSAAHQFVDALFVVLGCQLVRSEVPGRAFFFVWGLMNIGLALLLCVLRLVYRDRAP